MSNTDNTEAKGLYASPHYIFNVLDRIENATDDECIELLSNPETLFGFNILSEKPVNTLYDFLSIKKVSQLKQFAYGFGISGYSKMRKAELIDALCDVKRESVTTFFLLMSAKHEHLSAITDIMRSEGVYRIDKEGFPYEVALMLYCMLTISAYHVDGAIEIRTFEETRQQYQEFLESAGDIMNNVYDELDSYAAAAVNLYGIISLSDFTDLFSSQTGSDLEEISIKEILSNMIESFNDDLDDDDDDVLEYSLKEDFIIHFLFDGVEIDVIKRIHKNMQRQPLHILPKEEFLKYEDDLYVEDNKYTRELRDFFVSKLEKHDMADFIDLVMASIAWHLRQTAPFEDIFDMLEEQDIEMEDEAEARHFVELLIKMGNNTRMWMNNGCTPIECQPAEDSHSNVIPFPKEKTKVGRNDPCPCGSGKKYKNCCGKI